MRTVVYIVALLASIVAFGFVVGTGMDIAEHQLRQSDRALIGILRAANFLFGILPLAVLVVRVLIWVKRRKISAPISFSGVPFAVVCIALGLPVCGIGFYLLLSATGGGIGLSGVPLGFLLMLCAALALLAMAYVELQDWTALLAERRSKPRGQA